MNEDKTKLTKEEIRVALEELPGWYVDREYLKKDFVFENFSMINKFLPYLVEKIIEHNHHPDFSLNTGSKRISIEMTTHSSGGLTKADLDLATSIENHP